MPCNCRVAICLLMAFVLLAGSRVSPAQPVLAQPDPVLVALGDRIGTFLESVSLGESQAAYQALLAGSQLAKQDKALKELTDKTKQLQTKYGPYRRYEQIAAKRIGKDLVLLRYLYKCEHFPVVWYFAFYRTPLAGETPSESGDWRVISVRFDTKLELLAY